MVDFQKARADEWKRKHDDLKIISDEMLAMLEDFAASYKLSSNKHVLRANELIAKAKGGE